MKQPKFCEECGAKLVDGTCCRCESKTLVYRKLEDIPLDDRMQAFERIYAICADHMRGHYGEARCACECDCEQYLFEEAMISCLGPRIFEQLNVHNHYRLDEPAKKG